MELKELKTLHNLLTKFQSELSSSGNKTQASEVNHVAYLVLNKVVRLEAGFDKKAGKK